MLLFLFVVFVLLGRLYERNFFVRLRVSVSSRVLRVFCLVSKLGGFEKLGENLVDFAVENLKGQEGVLVAAVVFIHFRHHCHEVNELLEVLVVEAIGY